jgi:hypothetical protein
VERRSVQPDAGGEARYAQGLWVSGDFFGTLGVPRRGRPRLDAADDRRGCAAPPAVISHGFWQREYAATAAHRPQLMLNGHAYDIVGVTPPSFFGVEVGRAYDVAVPLLRRAAHRAASAAASTSRRLVPRRVRPA